MVLSYFTYFYLIMPELLKGSLYLPEPKIREWTPDCTTELWGFKTEPRNQIILLCFLLLYFGSQYVLERILMVTLKTHCGLALRYIFGRLRVRHLVHTLESGSTGLLSVPGVCWKQKDRGYLHLGPQGSGTTCPIRLAERVISFKSFTRELFPILFDLILLLVLAFI